LHLNLRINTNEVNKSIDYTQDTKYNPAD
jgi:hypothetical protein